MALSQWHTTAADNASAGTINWAEGQSPATINDSARQTMSDVRSFYENIEWRDFGDTPVYSALTAFTISTAASLKSRYPINRRIKTIDGTATAYGTIDDTTWVGTTQTVHITFDSGNLNTPMTSVSLGPDVTNQPIHNSGIKNTGTNAFAVLTANTFTANQGITSTDAGAGEGPIFELYRDSVSPAAADTLGGIDFYGRDSAGNKQLYGNIQYAINDPTSTSEDGKIQINTIVAGTPTLEAEITGGMILGSPTGSFKGAGTINAASGVYDNGNRVWSAGSAFTSSEIGLVQLTTTAVAHSLAVVPSIWTVSVRCKSAEYGYSINDEVLLVTSNTSIEGLGGFVNSTNIGFTLSVDVRVIDRTGGSIGTVRVITMANWKAVLRALA